MKTIHTSERKTDSTLSGGCVVYHSFSCDKSPGTAPGTFFSQTTFLGLLMKAQRFSLTKETRTYLLLRSLYANRAGHFHKTAAMRALKDCMSDATFRRMFNRLVELGWLVGSGQRFRFVSDRKVYGALRFADEVIGGNTWGGSAGVAVTLDNLKDMKSFKALVYSTVPLAKMQSEHNKKFRGLGKDRHGVPVRANATEVSVQPRRGGTMLADSYSGKALGVSRSTARNWKASAKEAKLIKSYVRYDAGFDSLKVKEPDQIASYVRHYYGGFRVVKFDMRMKQYRTVSTAEVVAVAPRFRKATKVPKVPKAICESFRSILLDFGFDLGSAL